MESELRALLYDAIGAFASDVNLIVAHPNRPFDPASLPAATKHYLRVSTLPSDPELIGVNTDEASYLWTAQVSVYARADIGELAPLRLAEALRAAFPRFHEFVGATVTFRVIRVPSIQPPVSTAGWFFFPVQFRVQAIQ